MECCKILLRIKYFIKIKIMVDNRGQLEYYKGMKKINIYLDDKIKEKVEKLGQNQGRSFAELIREATNDLLKKYKDEIES